MSAICAAHLSPYRLVPCSQPLQEEKGWVGFPSEAYHCERAALNLWLFLALALDPLLMHNVWEPLLSKLSLPGSLIMYQQRHPRAEACSRIMCNRLRSREVGNASRLTLSTSWCCGVCVCVCASDVGIFFFFFLHYITFAQILRNRGNFWHHRRGSSRENKSVSHSFPASKWIVKGVNHNKRGRCKISMLKKWIKRLTCMYTQTNCFLWLGFVCVAAVCGQH